MHEAKKSGKTGIERRRNAQKKVSKFLFQRALRYGKNRAAQVSTRDDPYF